MHRSLFHRSIQLFFLIALVVGTLGACGSDSADVVPDPDEVRSDKQRITSPQVVADDFLQQMAGNSAFAFDLHAQLRAEEGNLFYSPHSISMALAMLYAGARGDTETQMAQALHYVLPQDQLHPAFNKLDMELESRGKGALAADGEPFRLNVVNAVWGQRDYTFVPDYLDTLALNYGAGLRVLDFATDPEASRLTINDWVAEKTEDRILKLLPEGTITPMTRMVLTNAIYFNAAWATAFKTSATADGTFTLLDGTEKTVPLMHGEMDGRHAHVGNVQALELPYDGHELSMVVLLPDAGAFDEMESTLTSAKLDEFLGAVRSHVVIDLTLPKFETESSFGLKDVLESLGMVDAFTSGKADLSGLDGTRNLVVSAVLHKAFVKVNEEGTEAAAATAVVIGDTSVPEVVNVSVDRPFIFLVRDNATGAILFVGRILDPSA